MASGRAPSEHCSCSLRGMWPPQWLISRALRGRGSSRGALNWGRRAQRGAAPFECSGGSGAPAGAGAGAALRPLPPKEREVLASGPVNLRQSGQQRGSSTIAFGLPPLAHSTPQRRPARQRTFQRAPSTRMPSSRSHALAASRELRGLREGQRNGDVSTAGGRCREGGGRRAGCRSGGARPLPSFVWPHRGLGWTMSGAGLGMGLSCCRAVARAGGLRSPAARFRCPRPRGAQFTCQTPQARSGPWCPAPHSAPDRSAQPPT